MWNINLLETFPCQYSLLSALLWTVKLIQVEIKTKTGCRKYIFRKEAKEEEFSLEKLQSEDRWDVMLLRYIMDTCLYQMWQVWEALDSCSQILRSVSSSRQLLTNCEKCKQL